MNCNPLSQRTQDHAREGDLSAYPSVSGDPNAGTDAEPGRRRQSAQVNGRSLRVVARCGKPTSHS